jgi:hypothetical protein
MPGMQKYWWIGALVLMVGGLLVWTHFSGRDITPQTVADNSTLPGIQSGNAPWAVELTNLKARLAADGLPALAAEGTALHIHQHLDILVNGAPVAVPQGIGVNEAAAFISPIHVHDTTGVVHVESPVVKTFTLGQVFDVWGVRFSATCIGGYCADATHMLHVWADGKAYDGNPRLLPLTSHEEIVVFYGTEEQIPKDVPASFTFEPGL